MTVGSQLKQTLAGLRGGRGTLRLYANLARQEEAQKAYAEALQELDEIISALEERLSAEEYEEPQYKGY
jgi:hypothetical protein